MARYFSDKIRSIYFMNSSLDVMLPTSAIASSDADLFPTVTIALARGSVLEDGDSSLVYTFTRTGDTSRPLRVKYTVGGTASLGSDYTGISTVRRMKTLVIPAGSTTASVSVDPTADTSVEGDETVSLTLAARNYYTIGTSGPITGIIRNDDAVALLSTPPAVPSVSLSVGPAAVSEDGNANLIYTITRTGDTSRPLRVKYTVGGTASLGSDYTGISTVRRMKTLVIPAGSTTASVSVDPTADTSVEGDETVSLTLAARNYYTIGTSGPITGIIRNDDAVALLSTPPAVPSVSLSVGPAAVSEDGNANLIYTFTRTGDTSRPLRVEYTVGGTASLGSDYTGISTTGTTKSVTFAAGSATATVIVNPTADSTVEPDETVALTLAPGSGYTIGTTGAVTGTISNDDTDPITGLVPGSFREDFNGTSVTNQVWQVATWAEHGGQTGTERVFVKDGYLHMVLVNDSERGILSSAIQTREKFGYGRWEASLKPSEVPGVLNSFFTIDWDDFSTPNVPADGTKQEIDIAFLTNSFTNDSGEVHFAVHEAGRQSMNTNPDIALNFNPSAEFHVYGFDIKPDRIEWLLDGQTVYTYEYANNDITIDSTYQLKLNTWTRPDWIGGPPEQDVETTYMIDWIQFTPYDEFISDQSVSTLPSITLALAPGSVQEDGSTNLVYTFTRNGDRTNGLTVNYTVGGTASLGSDYTGISTIGTTKTVSFAAGSATSSVVVNPTADTTVEANETVALTLAAGTGYTIGTTGAVTGTITNDDVAPLPTITLAAPAAAVAEDGAANLIYTFTRSGSTSSALSFNYTVGGTATLGSDYSGISTTGTTKTVSFAAGSATATVIVNPTADSSVEADETVALTLAPGSGYTIGTPSAATGTISNDDTTPTPPPPPSLKEKSSLKEQYIPLSWDDPIYANTTNITSLVTVPIGESRSNLSIVVNRVDPALTASGSVNLDTIRIRNREGFRGGGGEMYLNRMYIDVTGVNPDHADGLQMYSPGNRGRVTLTNSYLKTSGSQTSPYFSADNWGGAHVLKDVVLDGGVYSFFIDKTGGTSISLKNVYIIQDSYIVRGNCDQRAAACHSQMGKRPLCHYSRRQVSARRRDFSAVWNFQRLHRRNYWNK